MAEYGRLPRNGKVAGDALQYRHNSSLFIVNLLGTYSIEKLIYLILPIQLVY